MKRAKSMSEAKRFLKFGNMPRVGKKPVVIPSKTDVSVSGNSVTVKGPLGTLSRVFTPDISIAVSGGTVVLSPMKQTLLTNALWGTYASHIENMVAGVNAPFEKKLLIEGIGYRAELSGKSLKLSIGFSHPVTVPIPDGIEVSVEKSLITIKGIDKEKVGQFAATVRKMKKPEPYKGKGIRYETEVIRRKQGKKAAA